MITKILYKINNDGEYIGSETITTETGHVYSSKNTTLNLLKPGDVIVNFLFTEVAPPQTTNQNYKFVNNGWVAIKTQEEIELEIIKEKEKQIALEKEKQEQQLKEQKIKELEELIATKEKLNTLSYIEYQQLQSQISELKEQ